MCTPSEALGGLKYVCEIRDPFEGRLAHPFIFDRSAFMTFLADIALTGLEMEEFISPMTLVDEAVAKVVVLEQTRRVKQSLSDSLLVEGMHRPLTSYPQ